MAFAQRAGGAGDGQRGRHRIDGEAGRGARVADNAALVAVFAAGNRNAGAARGQAGRKGCGVHRGYASGGQVAQGAASGGDVSRREAVGRLAKGKADGGRLTRFEGRAAAGDGQRRTGAGSVVGVPDSE